MASTPRQSTFSRSVQTLICLIILSFFHISCEENRHDVDVSNVELDLEIQRFDQQLFEWSALTFRQQAPELKTQYSGFYKHYFEDVTRIGSADDSLLFSSIRLFVTDQGIQQIKAAVEEEFEEISDIETDLISGWKHYKYYFPDREVPAHFTMISGLNTNVMVTDESVGISLDAYLGINNEIYELAQVPLYHRQKMIRERIAPDVIKGWLETEYVLQNDAPTLLEVIIHEGRLLYALDACFPEMEDSLKIGYAKSELAWANQFESNVWTLLVDEELLFSTDYEVKSNYVNDGPFTAGLSKDSPARMGVYLGWQVVRSFMNNNEELDLNDLMQINDAQEILAKSKYKP